MQRLKTLWQSAIATLILLPATVGAQATPPVVVQDFAGVLGILRRFLSWIYTIFFILAAIMIVWAAFNYLTSGGDEEKVEKAKKQFIYAVVAIAVAIVAASVSFVVANFFGTTVPTN